MPQPAVIVVLACAALAAGPARGDVFPYSATVRETVTLRGGPGETYYSTGRLPAGKEIEVHREHPGGWLAIRPPHGSYSWVAARYLRLGSDDVATIIGRGVVARIGGDQPGNRDVWQVELDYNEPVQVLGADETDKDQSGKPRWYKIAPPAGEFRFVPAAAIERKQETVKPSEGALRNASARDTDKSVSKQPAASRPPRIDSPQLRRELDSISFALSRRVSRPQAQWVLDDLQEQAADAESLARAPEEREAVRELQARIEGFATLADARASAWKAKPKAAPTAAVPRGVAVARGAKLEAMPGLAGRARTANGSRSEPATLADGTRSVPATLADGTRNEPARVAALPGRHDGVGRLVPMTVRNPGDPQYMLVDEHDLPLYFVSPAPGVNLRPYQGKIVGVTGNSAEQGSLNRRHIMAQRVEDAAGSRLR